MVDKFIPELDFNTGFSLTDLMVLEQRIPSTPETTYITVDSTLDLYAPNRYVIVPSVASNNLTIAIKDWDNNDPSATNPLPFRIGDVRYDLVAATSFTKNAGTNWMGAGGAMFAAQAMDFFVYAIGETGASAGIKFGYARIPHAKTMGDFVNTTTNEKYIAGNWTNFNSTDKVKNIGRFRAQLSATASFNWSIVSGKVVNFPIDYSDTLTWLPIFSGVTLATPSAFVSKYRIHSDGWIDYTIELNFGVATAITAAVTHVLPFACATQTSAFLPIGHAVFHDFGTAIYHGAAVIQGGDVTIRAMNAAGTYVVWSSLSSTVPFTWGSTDQLIITGRYKTS